MKALITGATGFIGKRLMRRLLQNRFEVVCAGRSLHTPTNCFNRTKAVYLDIEDRERVGKVFRKEQPEIVFHCAALTREQPLDILRGVNVEGTRNILDASLKEGVSKIVYLSSISVIAGNSTSVLTEELPYKARNHYGQSKIEAEQLVMEYRKKGLRIAILRPTMVYGEDDPHGVSLLIDLIRWRLFPILGSGENRISLVYVENVIDVMILSTTKDAAYEGTYIIADKERVSFGELFEYIAKTLGVKSPFRISQFLVSLFMHFPFVGKRLYIFMEDKVCSIRRLREKLGYIPRVSFYEGMKRTVITHKEK